MITSIFVLESHNEVHRTGRELYDDTIVRYNDLHWQDQEKISTYYFDIDDKQLFLSKLDYIFATVSFGEEIVIHFEMHGLENKTGLVLKSDEIIRWGELQRALLSINQKLRNNLNISMATCYGMHIFKILDFRSTAPFKSCISASNVIYPNEIMESYTPYYQCLVEHKDVFVAWNCLTAHSPDSNFYIKETEAQIEFIIEKFFELHFQRDFNRFKMYFLLFFDIVLPDRDNEHFEAILRGGLGSYQRRYIMRD